jgi:hypothetical protein
MAPLRGFFAFKGAFFFFLLSLLLLLPPHSHRNASIGSTRAARRAAT